MFRWLPVVQFLGLAEEEVLAAVVAVCDAFFPVYGQRLVALVGPVFVAFRTELFFLGSSEKCVVFIMHS